MDDEKGLDERALNWTKSVIPKTIERTRARYPDLTDEQAQTLEANLNTLVEDHFERTRLAFRHFWAETLNPRDLGVMSLKNKPLSQLLYLGLSWDPRSVRAGRAVLDRRARLREITEWRKLEGSVEIGCGALILMREWGFVEDKDACNDLPPPLEVLPLSSEQP